MARVVGDSSRVPASLSFYREKSSASAEPEHGTYKYPFDENGEAHTDVVSFPSGSKEDLEDKPLVLNAKEHAVGYLSRVLNARVYEAAIETELQEAKNLSAVSLRCCSHHIGRLAGLQVFFHLFLSS